MSEPGNGPDPHWGTQNLDDDNTFNRPGEPVPS